MGSKSTRDSLLQEVYGLLRQEMKEEAGGVGHSPVVNAQATLDAHRDLHQPRRFAGFEGACSAKGA